MPTKKTATKGAKKAPAKSAKAATKPPMAAKKAAPAKAPAKKSESGKAAKAKANGAETKSAYVGCTIARTKLAAAANWNTATR